MRTRLPLLSVLIPCFNREQYIDRCVRSVLNQPFRDLEIIVSDNSSTDRTLAILEALAREDARVKIIKNPTNVGAIMNWRTCLSAASGEYIHWLWSDDYIAPGIYDLWAASLREIDRVCPTCFSYNVVTKDSQKLVSHGISGWIEWRQLSNSICGSFPLSVSPAAYVMPKESVLRHFHVDITPSADINCGKTAIGPDLIMILGAALDAGGVCCIDSALVNFQSHEDSISVREKTKLGRHYSYAGAWFLAKEKVEVGVCVRARALLKGIKYRSLNMMRYALSKTDSTPPDQS